MLLLALSLLTSPAMADPYQDGVSALRAGKGAQAETLLEQAAKAQPERPEVWWELGWARWVQDDFTGAAEAWEKVKVLQPDHSELQLYLPNAHKRARLQQAQADRRAASAPDSVDTAAKGRMLSFAAAGDVMMGTDLRKGAAGLAPGNGEVLFEGVDEWFRQADVAFLNLEGPLADDLPQTKCSATSKHCYAFATPTRYVQALVDMGVDVASIANNHANDLGPAGMDSTMRTLDAVGIEHAGRYGDVARLERNGVVIGLVAAHSGSCCLNVNNPEEVAAAIREVDEWADIVVLSFHGGAEGAQHRHVPGKLEIGYGEKRGDVKLLARTAVDAGADLVLGHGPHVLRAMEVYRERLVVYSMGNFCGYKQFGTGGGYGGTSMVVEAKLAENGVLVAGRIRPVALDGESKPRPDPNGAAIRQVRELTEADFPDTGVRVAEDGALSWGEAGD